MLHTDEKNVMQPHGWILETLSWVRSQRVGKCILNKSIYMKLKGWKINVVLIELG